MNQKLIDFFKKAMLFLKTNWIPIVIIAGLIFFSGWLDSCANKKITAKNIEIANLKKTNADIDQQLKDRLKEYKALDAKLTQISKDLENLKTEKKNIEIEKAKIDKKYNDLYAKFGSLSAAQQDAALLEVLKKKGIKAEIRENSLVITLEDRGVLYTLIVSIDELREKLTNSEKANVTCEVTVTKQGEKIITLERKIDLKDADIKNYIAKIINYEQIIKDQKNIIFWTKVSSFAKKAIPALLIGLVVGYLVGK